MINFYTPILIRSKAWSGQLPDHVVFHRESLRNFTWRSDGPQQGKAVVVDSAGVEYPSTLESTANGVHQVAGFSMTCPILITDKSFLSDIINQKFDTIIHSEENL